MVRVFLRLEKQFQSPQKNEDTSSCANSLNPVAYLLKETTDKDQGQPACEVNFHELANASINVFLNTV